jgi:predicted Rossmann fold nucleotide-binding protein DprA/Smf involved in DNA uptake
MRPGLAGSSGRSEPGRLTCNWTVKPRLREHQLQPSFLLEGNLEEVLAGWQRVDNVFPMTRLAELPGRGGALGLALEKWQPAGLWVMTRSDPDYPGALKQGLKEHSPPVLFGCGNGRLLGQGGVAVVGSRNATVTDGSRRHTQAGRRSG